MLAEFRISQTTPGVGTPGRSRTDLIAGEVIELEATSPLGPSISYTWELSDKTGSAAVLTSASGLTSDIGAVGGDIDELASFKIKLTAYDSSTGELAVSERIACVRSSVTGLRSVLFAETAPASGTLAGNDPDLSTDNSSYVDLAGTGTTGQNWRGYAQWHWELLQVLEGLSGGGYIPSGPASGDLGLTYPSPRVQGLYGRTLAGTAPLDGQVIAWNAGASRWEPTTGGGGVTDHGALTGLADNDHPQYALAVRTFTAGTGLTGGGDFTADRTLNVAANADGSIIANANDIQVGVLATDAQHGARGGGTQHTSMGLRTPVVGPYNGLLSGNSAAGYAELRFVSTPPTGEPGVYSAPYYLLYDNGVDTDTVIVIGRSGAQRTLLEPTSVTWSAAANVVAYGGPALADAGFLSPATYESLIRGGLPRVKNAIESTAPTSDDGENRGYSIGSRWVDTVTGLIYICRDDASLSASWVALAPFSGGGTPSAVARYSAGGDSLEPSAILINNFGQIIAPAGSTSEPPYSWATQAGSGLFSPSAGITAVVSEGLEVGRFRAPAGANPQVLLASGSAAAPAVAFTASPGTGFLWTGAVMDLAVAGASKFRFSANEIQFVGSANQAISQSITNFNFGLESRITTSTTQPGIQIRNGGSFAATGQQRHVEILSTLNQTGAGGFSQIIFNQTQTALGSGTHRFLDLQVGGTTTFAIASDATQPGQVQAPQGNAARPSYSFHAGTTTGIYWNGGLQIAFSYAGAARLSLGGASTSWGLSASTTNTSLILSGNVTTSTIPTILAGGVTITGASVAQVGVSIPFTLNQSGTSGFTHLLMNQTQTAIGSGTHRFADFQVGGVTAFAVTSDATMPGQVLAAAGTGARPSYAFAADATEGFFRASAAAIGVTYAGVQRWSLGNTNIYSIQSAQDIIIGTQGAGSQMALVGRVDGATGANAIKASVVIGNYAGLPFIGSSVAQCGVEIPHTINQTGTSAFTSLRINQTQTALGSGAQRLLDLQTGGTTRFAIASDATLPGQVQAPDGTAARPSYAFLNSTGLGFYRFTGNYVGFSAVGVERLFLGGGSNLWGLGTLTSGDIFTLDGSIATTGDPAIALRNASSFTGSAAAQVHTAIQSTLNQTSTAGFTSLRIDQTQTAVGGGDQLFMEMRIGGVRQAAIASRVGDQPGRYLGPDGNNDSPTYSFLSEPTTGIYFTTSEQMGMTFANNLTYIFDSIAGIYPQTDNTKPLGGAANRWTTLWSAAVSTGDIDMRDPNPGDKPMEEVAHWKLVEGLNGIWAYNVRTKRKFKIAMEDVEMAPEDFALMDRAQAPYMQKASI
jgi:hypothetical protein